jgi:methyltransferase-like protein/SAM-dependent methyltransferase
MTAPDFLQDSYDNVPYPLLSYRQTHPNRLAMVALMLGLEPAPPHNCRLLELGTASGGNIIPMAAHIPTSHFVGVDFSPVQIVEGQQIINDLGLDNIELHAMDVADITPELGEFDYIVAHGLFSWVPDEVRTAILNVCKQNLAPNGVVYMSYNCYPGWHMLGVSREMMLYHTDGIDDPVEKVRAATDFMQFVRDNHVRDSNEPFTAFIDGYLELLGLRGGGLRSGRDFSSVYHDEMESYNQPFYFEDFMARVREHELDYLADANFASNMPNSLPMDAQQKLAELSGQSLVRMEQYMDFIRNRGFRMSLLVHQGAPINRRLSLRPIVAFLRTVGYAKPEPNSDDPDALPTTFSAGKEATFKTDHPVTQAAFLHLYENRPKSFTFTELIEAALARLGKTEGDADDAEALALNILRAMTFSSQLLDLEPTADDFIIEPSDHPQTSDCIRYLAQRLEKVTNLRHERVELDDVVRTLIQHMDGTHSRDDLVGVLQQHMREGTLTVVLGGERVQDPDAVQDHLYNQLNAALDWMARSALLTG